MLDNAVKEYAEKVYNDSLCLLQQARKKIEEYDELPDDIAKYDAIFEQIRAVEDSISKVSISFDLEWLRTSIQTQMEELHVNALKQEDEINMKFEKLIEEKIAELKEEARTHNKAEKEKLNRNNRIFEELEAERQKLLLYADEIIDACSLYGVTTTDTNITADTYSVSELKDIYAKCLDYLGKTGRRVNAITLLRQKFSSIKVQGILLLLCMVIIFTPVWEVFVLAGVILLLKAQLKADKKVQMYAMILGVTYNIKPLEMGHMTEVPKELIVSEEIDEETDERIAAIADDWMQELESLGEDTSEEEGQELLRELVNKTAGFNQLFKEYIKKFDNEKDTCRDLLRSWKNQVKTKYEELKSKLSLLGDKVSTSVVFDTSFVLGLKNKVIEERVDLGLTNLVINPNVNSTSLTKFLQVLFANALCNVKAGNLHAYIYDPNTFGQQLVSFYDAELDAIMTFETENLEKIVTNLKEQAMKNMKDCKGLGINEFNKIAEENEQVEKDYNLLIVMSQPKRLEENEALVNFMQYSATMGIFIWLLSENRIENTRFFSRPFEGVSEPYQINLNTFGQSVCQVVKKALKANKPKPLFWSKFAELLVPEDKIWTYSCNKVIDIDPGLQDGDPSKTKGYSVGHSGDIHALAAGRTGAGKSVFLNNLIANMCLKYSPRELELWLVDYKSAEFGFYMPKDDHLYTFPHIKACLCTTDGDYAESLYAAMESEMIRRTKQVFPKHDVKSLKEYNELMEQRGTPEQKLPRILLINDEFQVIFEKAEAAVAERIIRLLTSVAKLGRAPGVHLLFTSQSMNKTVPADVLAQFSLRFALKCDADVSNTMLGNKKAATMKESMGFCFCASTTDGSPDLQRKYKIPLLENDVLRAHMKKMWDKARAENYPQKDIITYDEQVTYAIEELDADYDRMRKEGANVGTELPGSGLILLGNRMTYSSNKAPENIVLLPENDSHIFSCFSETSDLVDFYKQIMRNIHNFSDEVSVFVNSQVKDLHYLCGVDLDMTGEDASLSSTGADVFSLYSMFEAIYNKRVETNNKGKQAYFVLVGWDKARGFGMERDFTLASSMAVLLKQCGEYNMHFVFICSGIGSINSSIVESCKFKICGKTDEKTSSSVLDSRVAMKQYENVSKGYLFLKSGNSTITRAKLYLSPKDRVIKESTLVL